jgi:hypothetical protein
LLAPAFPSKILGYINGGLHSEGKWLRLLFLTLELKVDTKSLSIIMGPYVTIYKHLSISQSLFNFFIFMTFHPLYVQEGMGKGLQGIVIFINLVEKVGIGSNTCLSLLPVSVILY